MLVGRNNRQNDELTHRVARPTDVWMHARGVPGAHVLLRRPNDEKGDAPAADLQFAADLAAWFSKVHTACSTYVPMLLWRPVADMLKFSGDLMRETSVAYGVFLLQARLDSKVPVITAAPKDLKRPKVCTKQIESERIDLLNIAVMASRLYAGRRARSSHCQQRDRGCRLPGQERSGG